MVLLGLGIASRIAIFRLVPWRPDPFEKPRRTRYVLRYFNLLDPLHWVFAVLLTLLVAMVVAALVM